MKILFTFTLSISIIFISSCGDLTGGLNNKKEDTDAFSIRIVNVDGSNGREIFNCGETRPEYLQYSPDGQKLIFGWELSIWSLEIENKENRIIIENAIHPLLSNSGIFIAR